ncbi:hypothetical protein HII31_00568 [Pseudocercospora fuligena]|uniref:Heterokaryon incompatibility domain-containing protein n=1 Tax=Pseudocercospora fuligena TaxID=685502 RepID=A0A8H6RVJ8_9PEZI|nr:hypothetical protein HII31_00568 [Pseudocercospora fuligena]
MPINASQTSGFGSVVEIDCAKLPLHDATKQIRLLHFGRNALFGLSCSLTVHDLDGAMEYTPSPMLWGSRNDKRQISLNGVENAIGTNYYDALLQTRPYDPATPIWVDSICIIQADSNEKSARITAMVTIFSKPRRVFACVGPESESNRALMRTGKQKHLSRLLDPGLLLGSPELDNFVRSRTYALVCKLAEAVTAFCNSLPYWERLWVAQELYEARGRASILCDNSDLHWTASQKILCLTETYFVFTQTARPAGTRLPPHLHAMTNMVNTRDEVLFPEILASACILKCRDSRDRIYGILRLIDWQAEELKPLFPDYRLTKLELVVQALRQAPRKTLTNAETIARAMDVDIDGGALLAQVKLPTM